MAPITTSSRLGWVAAVIEMVSPSQPNPSTIQMMWTSSTLVAMLFLLERCPLVASKKLHTSSLHYEQRDLPAINLTTARDIDKVAISQVVLYLLSRKGSDAARY